MPGIFVRPDADWQMVRVVASFEVDPDVPDAFVTNTIYPQRRELWIKQMALRGYMHRGGVYLFPKRYAVTETSDDGAASVGRYEHRDARRQKVSRKMMAYFWKRKAVVPAQDVEEPHG